MTFFGWAIYEPKPTPPDCCPALLTVINIDSMDKSNEKVGCGGLSCDNRGRWIKGFSKNIGVYNSLIAEFWGVLET